MKPIRALALAAAVSALAIGAQASTVELTYNGQTAYQTVKITENPFDDGYTGNVRAGAFNMSGTSSDPDAPASILDPFVAWCLDIGAFMFSSGERTYETTDEPFKSYPVNKTAVTNFFDANFGSVTLSDANENAAFQIGLWATIYGDTFSYYSQNVTLNALVTAFVNAGTTYTGERIWTLTYLESTDDPRFQNLVTATPIPLPATGFLMLGVMGLGGIGVMARRRRDKAA